MYTIAVANVKGGAGKSTVATHIAAHFALLGERVCLGELDRQKSALSWLKRRPEDAVAIEGVDFNKDGEKPHKKTDVLVVDAGAAMRREAVKEVVKKADVIVIPVLPSVFDEDGTRRFVDYLETLKPIRKNKRSVVFIANRVKSRTKAADRLDEFLAELDFPIGARLRDSQAYAHAALAGISLFEMPKGRVKNHLEDWAPLLEFLESARR